MRNEHKKVRSHPDLTRTETCEKSVGAQLEDLVKTADIYSLYDLKSRLNEILDNKNTSISGVKAAQYKSDMNKIYSLEYMRRFITNIYLASANLGMKLK